MFGLIPNNLSSYGNEAVAVPHPPLRGTLLNCGMIATGNHYNSDSLRDAPPPGEGISAKPQSFKQQFHDQLMRADRLNPGLSLGFMKPMA